MAHPPGWDTLARPNRATKGPRTSTLARIVLTRSYGASHPRALVESRRRTPSPSQLTPRWERRAHIVRTSLNAGTFSRTNSPGTRSEAAISGKAAFFAPLTATSPRRGTPPSMRMRSAKGPPRHHAGPPTEVVQDPDLPEKLPGDPFHLLGLGRADLQGNGSAFAEQAGGLGAEGRIELRAPRAGDQRDLRVAEAH